jgi:hypothetical protein
MLHILGVGVGVNVGTGVAVEVWDGTIVGVCVTNLEVTGSVIDSLEKYSITSAILVLPVAKTNMVTIEEITPSVRIN